MPSHLPKFRNDRGVAEIRIGRREFHCIGVSPPQDHPHVYINMGDQDTILCPYCATLFRFDPLLGPFAAEPSDSLYADPEAAPLFRFPD
ncbi:MAG: zinc-finger domain-containing protein [Stellaceae bacterium]